MSVLGSDKTVEYHHDIEGDGILRRALSLTGVTNLGESVVYSPSVGTLIRYMIFFVEFRTLVRFWSPIISSE